MKRQRKKTALLYFAFIGLCIISLTMCSRKPVKWWVEGVRTDYQNEQSTFESIIDLFPTDDYKKIESGDYDKKNSGLYRIFEELGYKAVYSDYKGNIFFNKYGDGLTFIGLVYARSPEYVIDIIKTESFVLDEEETWIAYHASGF